MRLLREVTEGVPQPVIPKDGWNVGHLAHHGIMLSCDGFSMRLDLEQLNLLFDYAEDGMDGELRDHAGNPVYVEVNDDTIILSRDNDKTYPSGAVLDAKTLKEMGIEQYEEEQPEDEDEEDEPNVTIEPEEVKEGVKRAFRRVGNKIKRGFRVTSGWRKGRVVSSPSGAFKKRPRARTRMKLRIAARRRKVVRILKSARTRKRSVSKRLRRLNRRIK
jgi:hypothetical protein